MWQVTRACRYWTGPPTVQLIGRLFAMIYILSILVPVPVTVWILDKGKTNLQVGRAYGFMVAVAAVGIVQFVCTIALLPLRKAAISLLMSITTVRACAMRRRTWRRRAVTRVLRCPPPPPRARRRRSS